MYEIEDITDNMDDGFNWLSVIGNMEMYRAQVAESSNGGMILLHIYGESGNILNMEEHSDMVDTIEAYLDTTDDYDYSDEWKEEN
jgi:hypothetical protein